MLLPVHPRNGFEGGAAPRFTRTARYVSLPASFEAVQRDALDAHVSEGQIIPLLVSSPGELASGYPAAVHKFAFFHGAESGQRRPGVFGEKVTLTPRPATKYSSGPAAMKMAPAKGWTSCGAGVAGRRPCVYEASTV